MLTELPHGIQGLLWHFEIIRNVQWQQAPRFGVCEVHVGYRPTCMHLLLPDIDPSVHRNLLMDFLRTANHFATIELVILKYI